MKRMVGIVGLTLAGLAASAAIGGQALRQGAPAAPPSSAPSRPDPPGAIAAPSVPPAAAPTSRPVVPSLRRQ